MSDHDLAEYGRRFKDAPELTSREAITKYLMEQEFTPAQWARVLDILKGVLLPDGEGA